MSDPAGKGVIHRGLQKNNQFICCSEPGCAATLEVPIKGSPKPGDVILNMARRRGWRVDGDGRKVRLCPTHAGSKSLSKGEIEELMGRLRAWCNCGGPLAEKRKSALATRMAQLGIRKVSEAATSSQRDVFLDLFEEPELQETEVTKTKAVPPVENQEATGLALLPLSESLKLPSGAARAQRREVFRELEECYGDGQYLPGFSDQYVATKLAVSIGMVREVREQNFGPAGPDPRIIELRQKIAGLETRISQIEEAALQIMEQAENRAKELRRDIASLLDQINKIEEAL